MLESLAEATGLPIDVPFDELEGRHRRLIMYGTGSTWIPVYAKDHKEETSPPLFQFQFKGLYPALEEAARLSPTLRNRLDYLVGEIECGHCGGSRLRDDATAVRFRGKSIDQLCRMPLGALQETIHSWKLDSRERKIAGDLIHEIQSRVQFLNDVGLDYLTLARPAASLSGGEAQRIRLASQLGSGLSGVLYVLDEPTIGLHPRDNQRLIRALHKLRNLGNTLVLVEHDREVIEGSDHVIDFGPAAGKQGGQIVGKGAPAKLGSQRSSVTGPYLSGKKVIPIPKNRRISTDEAEQILRESDPALPTNGKRKIPAPNATARAKPKPAHVRPFLTVRGARHNNLRSIDVRFPLGTLTAVTGVSGSGKSSLVNDVLHASLAKTLHRASVVPGAHDKIEGIEHINKVVRVDQQPLGNSPSTYTGAFELIRTLFAQLPEAKLRGFTARRFSFNVPGGRCEACEGNGQKRIEMHFLPDVWVTCESCQGRRYNEQTLSVRFHGHSIAEVLNLTCDQAVQLFGQLPKIRRVLQTLCDVGLGYLTLGQPAPTLSGGEAQRVKLAAELGRPDTGRTLYLLDEPTTGLHFGDLAKLLDVLNRLVDLGNTVIVIEHNLDVIKTADWIIDIGPEAGAAGGKIVVQGTPEQVVAAAGKRTPNPSANGKKRKKLNPSTRDGLYSHTAQALSPVLDAGRYVTRKVFSLADAEAASQGDLEIEDVGKDALMPWQVDGRAWHTRDRVGRNGGPCRWDGRILEKVVDRIHELADFSPTNWESRTIVEITGKTASHGWFFHALTGETWLLKLKFRAAKRTFRSDSLLQQIQLKPMNEMHDLPIYGNEPRVTVKSAAGPWQEIEIRAHSLSEIDTPEFWSFLETAVEGFQKVAQRAAVNPEDLMPWKKLGRKWHLSKRGFPIGKQMMWDHSLLERLFTLLEKTTSDGRFVWDNQSLVHLLANGHTHPWATVHTKRADSLDLVLSGPKNVFGLGRIASIGYDRELDTSSKDRDIVKLRFRNLRELGAAEFREFLDEHYRSLTSIV
jgi:excinuclease ABC subunit A